MEGSSTRLVSGTRAADSDHGALARAGYFLTCAGSRAYPSSQSRRCDLSEDHDPAEAILPRAARRVRVMMKRAESATLTMSTSETSAVRWRSAPAPTASLEYRAQATPDTASRARTPMVFIGILWGSRVSRGDFGSDFGGICVEFAWS